VVDRRLTLDYRLAVSVLAIGIVLSACAGVVQDQAARSPEPTTAGARAAAIEWPAYGRDLEGTRYLPATGITRENVGRLALAWTYRTGEADSRFKTKKTPAFETTPIVADGVLYVSTPLGRVIALDASTGQERWVFDPHIRRDITYGDFVSRGVSTWLDDEAARDQPCRRTIYVANAESQLIALDAANGRPCARFGREGRIDLKAGLRIPPFEAEAYTVTSPPLAANGLVVVGSSIGDNSRPNPASGEVRAFDARRARCAGRGIRYHRIRLIPPTVSGGATWHTRRERRTRGRHCPPTRSATSYSFRPPARHPTTTAACGWATTATRIRSSHSGYRRASACGHSRPCTTIYGTTTTQHRPRWSRCSTMVRRFPRSCRPRRPACCSCCIEKPANRSFRSRNAPFPRATCQASRPLRLNRSPRRSRR
jgi:hypothetical protein